MRYPKITLPVASLVVGLLSFVFTCMATAPVQAVTKSDWKAGHIISDDIFYDGNAMSVQQIQSFLNSKVSSCDTWGRQPASEWGRSDISRAQYAKQAGWDGPPYICLKDYHQVPRSDTIIDNYNSTASRPSGSISAAQIIYNAAKRHSVSPKALLVLLHKESAGPLTFDSWPLKKQYRSAMGYACPDTAPCDAQYAGFYNQVMNAAKRIETYKNNPSWYRHQPFSWNSTVYYHPDLGRCGSSKVYIETRATAGLYNYTPYQPNSAALNNLYGTGDSCSAYGNRNFWRIYNDWFGSTQQRRTYTQFSTPRWMELRTTAQKVHPDTGKVDSYRIAKGAHVMFNYKTTTSTGKACYRTERDSSTNGQYCVLASDLKEITPILEPISPTIVSSPSSFKQRRSISEVVEQTHAPAVMLTATATTRIGRTTYYVPEGGDGKSGIDIGTVQEVSGYKKIASGNTVMTTQRDKSKVFPESNTNLSYVIGAGRDVLYGSYKVVNGTRYYRTAHDTKANVNKAVPESDLELPSASGMKTPRWFSVTRPSIARNVSTYAIAEEKVEKNYEFYADTKIVLAGRVYIKDATTDRFILLSDVSGIPVEHIEPKSVDVAIDGVSLKQFSTLQADSSTRTYNEGDAVKVRSITRIRDTDYYITTSGHLVEQYAISGLEYTPMKYPRSLTVVEDTRKYNLKTGEHNGYPLRKGQTIKFVQKITVNDVVYLRTQYDIDRGIDYGVRYDELH